MRTLIAIPCMDMVHTIFMKALLGLRTKDEIVFSIACSSLVYDARNNLCKQAIRENFDKILWLDSDMDFQPDILDKLSEDLSDEVDMVGALYIKRKAPLDPVVYEKVGWYQNEDKTEITPMAVPYVDYPKDQLFECDGIGFGGVLMKVELAKKIDDRFGLPFSPINGFGEDLSFCARAKEVGSKIWCDSRVKMGHVGLGTVTEETYLQMRGQA